MRRIQVLMTVVAMMTAMLAVVAGTAAAHPHVASHPDPDQVIANGQNHPSYSPADSSGLRHSCEDANTGPAYYGLESAHHGPDAGTPGKADGCYATQGDPQDNNPGIS